MPDDDHVPSTTLVLREGRHVAVATHALIDAELVRLAAEQHAKMATSPPKHRDWHRDRMLAFEHVLAGRERFRNG